MQHEKAWQGRATPHYPILIGGNLNTPAGDSTRKTQAVQSKGNPAAADVMNAAKLSAQSENNGAHRAPSKACGHRKVESGRPSAPVVEPSVPQWRCVCRWARPARVHRLGNGRRHPRSKTYRVISPNHDAYYSGITVAAQALVYRDVPSLAHHLFPGPCLAAAV